MALWRLIVTAAFAPCFERFPLGGGSLTAAGRLLVAAAGAGRAAAGDTSAATGSCRLTALALRFKDQPVELVPAFDPDTFVYYATLDFRMDAFSVDVQAAQGCEADQAPNQAVALDRGGAEHLWIYAKAAGKGSDRQSYSVKIGRLRGSETEVQWLSVNGAVLDPPFSPKVRSYTANLALGNELARLSYKLRDEGQHIRCSGDLQRPVTRKGRSLDIGAADDTTGDVQENLDGQVHNRRLGDGAGELQYLQRHQSFPVDAGYARTVTLSLQSADPMQAALGYYTIRIIRAGCGMAKPLYDPKSQTCVVGCPSEFYQNFKTYRCSKCNTNCGVCRSLVQCDSCYEDTLDISYLVKPDGSCAKVSRELQVKYWWWCVGFAMFLALLICICCGLVCQWLCTCCPRRRRLPNYTSESDDDSEAEFLQDGRKRGWR